MSAGLTEILFLVSSLSLQWWTTRRREGGGKDKEAADSVAYKRSVVNVGKIALLGRHILQYLRRQLPFVSLHSSDPRGHNKILMSI